MSVHTKMHYNALHFMVHTVHIAVQGRSDQMMKTIKNGLNGGGIRE